jgi:multidrug resistance efflux pump
MGVLGVQHKPKKGTETDHFFFDTELWASFANADSREEYFRNWLSLLCSSISNTIQGVLSLGDPENESFTPVAKWPEDGQDPERLAEISEHVLEERSGLLVELKPPPGQNITKASRFGLAYPILMDDQLYGAIALEVMADTEEQLKSTMGHMQWGVSWVELIFRRRQIKEDEASMARLRTAVDMLAGVLSEKTFESASMAFVTEMATQLGCDRVSLAFMHKNHAKIQAISHSAQFGKRMNLIRAIGKAMDEAITQRKEIFYPIPSDGEVLIVREHERLAKQHGAGSILTMPFYGEEKYHGALILERPSEEPFSSDEASFCNSVTSLLFPALEMRRQNDRLLILKAWDALTDQLKRLFGPRYLGRKLLFLMIAAIVIFFSVKIGDYKISADTVLEGAVKRVVVAPFDGYVKEAPVRAGDVVAKGTLMCTLDDRDLRLERLNWLSKQTQYQRKYQEASAKHDRAEAKIIKAQLDQSTAKLSLVESQLERTQISAPFKGIVLSGDLSQRLGGSVEKGEVLFEVAPLDVYRIILQVDEHRIADVKVGQRGSMILSSLPNEYFDFVVEKITPLTTAKEGLNYFRVEARLDRVSESLRPGMEGVGKISVDQRKLISIWTRGLKDWLRLKIWSWWP